MLKEDASEFGETYRIRHLVTRYSDHVSIPVYLKNEVEKVDDSEAKSEWDQVNQATALWTRPRTGNNRRGIQPVLQARRARL